ncbi:MAG: pilus assembly protein PilM [Deltaproteobacteria bacterium]|nr:MAG: pilus assembly protein PilM [Deltaproteobacteria bacterium]
MSKNILGLDIRKSAISAVLIESSLKKNRLEAFTYVPIVDQDDVDTAMASALEMLLENIDIAGAICIASLPADQISMRNISVPFKQSKKIKQVLPFELEPTLPYAVQDLVIDFRVVSTEGQTNQTNLLAAAIDISTLKKYLELLSSFEIEPEIVTVGSYPIAVCLSSLADIPENAMFVDMDDEKSTLTAFKSGQICLIRSFPTGFDGTTRLASLCKNIQRTIHAFEDTTSLALRPDKIFITGSSLDENGFENQMTQELGIPTQRMDLVRDINLKLDNHPLPSWNPNKMDSALALALIDVAGIRGLNFRKGPFAVKKRWAEHKKSLIRTGILAVAVLLLALANIVVDFYAKQQKLDTLNTQIGTIFKSTFPDVERIVDPVQQMRVKIEEVRRVSLSPEKSVNNKQMVDILNEISNRISKQINVEFTRLVIGEDSVLISGDTAAFNSVDEMKSQLEHGNIFKEVTIVSTNKDKSGNRIRFKLKLQL